ncbi:helix-turn-helix transcriptional regulator [Micromonospora sp. WMMD980]|uniref:helix-turn-helix transcriptional regulator n=1 Tax=Micromonospora sp. WMMD980 TaxID=3016088 RepID=UPI0024175C90|nr:helix-turn-helix transcriptional regulator [Micromonospora sp. WMMD980]MDG4804717.1 helix-turn-helix transcriptional regulator [Micromonospora sp. WMMD980]
MTESRLVRQIAHALRHERERAGLTQQALADRAGLSQAAIARIERGDRLPSLTTAERLLTALGRQLRIEVEPLDSHLDAALDEAAAADLDERLTDLKLDRLVDALGDLPYVLAGSTAALLQGAPIPVAAVEIAVRWRDSSTFTAFLERAYAQRWNARWGEWGGVRHEPEERGEHRWLTRHGELRARMVDELPEPIEVRHGGRTYPVEPLVQVEVADRRTAELLRRHRQRLAAGTGEPDEAGGSTR